MHVKYKNSTEEPHERNTYRVRAPGAGASSSVPLRARASSSVLLGYGGALFVAMDGKKLVSGFASSV